MASPMFIAYLGLGGGILGLLFALFLSMRILSEPDGNQKMVDIAQAVRDGAGAYLKQQYFGVSVFFLIIFVILLILSLQGYFLIFIPIC